MVNIQSDEKLARRDRMTVAGVSLVDVDSAVGQLVILYGTSGCSKHGYFATAPLLRAWREPLVDSRVFVSLGEPVYFPTVVPPGQAETDAQAKKLDEGVRPWEFPIGVRRVDHKYYQAIVERGYADDPASSLVELAEPDPPGFELPIEVRQRELIERLRRQRLRRQVLRRDGAFCHLSHAVFSEASLPHFLDVSHLHPLGKGGPDVMENMVMMRKEIHQAWEFGYVTTAAGGAMIFALDIPDVVRSPFCGQTSSRRPVLTAAEDAQMETYLQYHRRNIFRQPELL